MGNLRLTFGAGIVIALSAAPIACGSAFTAGSSASDSGADASTDGVGAEGGDAGDSGIPTEAPAGKTIYVSASTGDDKNSGLSPQQAVKTIATGLTLAAPLGTGAEVRVCAGTYPESSLSVQKDVALLGSYSCSTWTRSGRYGFPTFDSSTLSNITNAAPTVQLATLLVTGQAVTSATLIDGFAFAGATGITQTSYGIDVAGAASPVIHNVMVGGGGGTAGPSGGWGSVGVRIGGTSSAELSLSLLGGGTGTGPGGSVGVLLDSTGAASVHDLVVSGGTGKTTGAMPNLASAGVAFTATLNQSKSITGAAIFGSDATPGVTGTSAGIVVQGTGVGAVIDGCEIQGGTGSGANTASVGILVSATGSVVVEQDRILGGLRTGSSVTTYGVLVAEAGGLTVENTEIHAGTVPLASGDYAVGIDVSSTPAPVIEFDTIYTGGSAGTDVAINSGVTGARVTDDILLGSDASLGTFALAATSCAMGTFATLDHTAFGNEGALYACGPTGMTTTMTTIVELLTTFGSQAAGDVLFESPCAAADMACAHASCPGPPATCLLSIFGNTWSSDDGMTSLFTATGADGGKTDGAWALSPGSSCKVANGGTPITGITSDLLGNPRTPAPTMGAVQYNGASPCMN